MILPDCTIVIPTRNRAKTLKETIDILCDQGLVDTPVIVVDDASDDPDATEAAAAGLKSCRVIRQQVRTGQAGARNVGLRAAETEYILLLDDDCHLASVEPLIRFLANSKEEETVIWRFTTVREYDGDRMGIPAELPRSRFAVAVGNGVLLDRRAILSLNGFRDFFVYRYEEGDLSIRVFGVGWHITYVPDVEFVHRHIPNKSRGQRFCHEYEWLTVRNAILFYGLNYPFPVGFLQAIARAMKSAAFAPKGMFRSRVQGFLDGVVALADHWESRTPLTYKQLRAWRKLNREVQARIREYAEREEQAAEDV